MHLTCIDHGQAAPGYGRSGHVLLHRRVFEQANGYLPAVVRHTCDNPRCINPAHLLGGTHADNMADKVARGRTPRDQPALRQVDAATVRAVRKRYAERKKYDPENGTLAMSREYGITRRAVTQIAQRLTYRDVE